MKNKLLFFVTKKSLRLYTIQKRCVKLIANSKEEVNKIIDTLRKEHLSYDAIPLIPANKNLIALYLDKIESIK